MKKKILKERLQGFENGEERWRVSASLTPRMCWEVYGEGDTRKEACRELESALMGLINECQEALRELEEFEQGETHESTGSRS